VLSQDCDKRLPASSSPSVRTLGKTGLPIGGFLWNLTTERFSKICRENSSFKKTGQENRALSMKQIDIHLWSYLAHFSLQWEILQTKVVQKIKTHILCSVTFFENRTVYEIMWENIVERGRLQMAIWRMRIVYGIPKATNSNSEYVILIAIPLQQR